MIFRVPAELDFLLPAYPKDNDSSSRPWRGDLRWLGPDNEPTASEKHLAHINAVETEGDSRFDLWPKSLSLRISRQGFSLPEIHAWVRNVAPPICMLVPASRTRDPATNKANDTIFRRFGKLLRDRQAVAISRWHAGGRGPGPGLVIFPVEASDGLLAAAVFHSSPIPEFSPSQPQHAGYQVSSSSSPPLPRPGFTQYPDFYSPASSPSPSLGSPEYTQYIPSPSLSASSLGQPFRPRSIEAIPRSCYLVDGAMGSTGPASTSMRAHNDRSYGT